MRSESLQSFDGSLRSCKKQKPCTLISPVMLERTGYVISAHFFRLMCHHTLSLISSLPQVFRITPGCVTVGFPCCLTLVKLQKLLWSCWIASWLVVHHRILLEFPFRAWSSLAAAGPMWWPLLPRSQLCWVAMSYFAVKRQDTPPQHLRGSNLPCPTFINKVSSYILMWHIFIHTSVVVVN